MSMSLIVQALKTRVGNAGRKLVLIKLADNANDKGECWPSYQHVADQCEMGRSTVKAHIKALEEAGFLTVTDRNGGNSSNHFKLHIGSGKLSMTGSESDPVKIEPGQNLYPTRSDSAPLTRSESDPRTSHFFEPTKEPKDTARKRAAVSALDFSSWPTKPSKAVLDDWQKVRKAKRAPLSQTAINRMAKELHQAVHAGLTVDECLGICCERGWQGFKFEWVQNAAGRFNPPSRASAPRHFSAAADYSSMEGFTSD